LLSAKGVVSAIPALTDNFEKTANFLTEQFDKLKSMTLTRCNVTAAATNPDCKNNQKKGKARKGATSKKKTFVPHKEWWALSKAQRTKIREEQEQKNVTERTFAAEEREKEVPAAEKDAPQPEQ
jgi:hypothetical protein